MNFEKHFREQDIPEAIKEIKCIEDLMRLVLLNIHSGDSGGLERAETRLYEVLRSVERLMHLNKAKRNEDMIMAHRELLEEFFDAQNQTLHN